MYPWLKRYVQSRKRLLIFVKLVRKILCRYLYYFRHKRMISDYLRTHQIRKLQIGSGRNAMESEGWLNTDYDAAKTVVFLDAAKKIPFADATFDYVYHEHFLEHLEYKDGMRFFRECIRILKPGGKLRISTPDMRFLIELYNENKTELQRQYIEWAGKKFTPDVDAINDCVVINNFFRDWGHKFIYDSKTLRNVMEEYGLVDIHFCEPGESIDENLRNLEVHGRQIDEFNRLETMILEAKKPYG